MTDVNDRNADLHQDTPTERKTRYRAAFVVALAAALFFAVATITLWWRLSHKQASPMSRTAAPTATQGGMSMAPDQTSQQSSRMSGNPPAGEMAPQETPLAPLQLSPQPMQSIGVQIRTSESKHVSAGPRSSAKAQANARR